MDKNAVKEYSEFSFTENSRGAVNYKRGKEGQTVGYKVIKKSGETEIVDLDNAVEIQSENRETAKKIAVPNLQVGDIIDYFYHQTSNIQLLPTLTFTPVVTTLLSQYPVKYMRYRFDLDDIFYLSYRPINGAPEIKRIPGKKFDSYTFEARNLEKQETAEMMYPYRSLPTLKYQVVYGGQARTATRKYYDKQPDKVKSFLSEEELKDLIQMTYYTNIIAKSEGGDFKYRLKTMGESYSELSDAELIKIYYRDRHFYEIERKLEDYYLENKEYPLPYGSRYFVNQLRTVLTYLEFDFEVLVTTKREYGDMEDAVLPAELEYLFWIKIKDGKDIYLPTYELHPDLDRIPAEFEGQKAVAFAPEFGGSRYSSNRPIESHKVVIPKSTYEDNQSVNDSEISFSEDLNSVLFKNTYTYSGHSKDFYQYRLVNLYDYWEQDHEDLGVTHLLTKRGNRESVKTKQLMEEQEKRYIEFADETVKAWMANDYAAEEPEIKNYKVLQTGRLGSGSNEFVYEVEGSLDNLIQRAGPNYLLSAGMLIGTQREIEEKDKDRKVDIHGGYARSFYNNVTVKIPEGYTVEGIDKLNMNVVNDTGAFISTAKIEGSNLIIKTEKWYADNYEPVEEWEKMLEFLEAAYEFTTVKVLLKKK